MTKPHIVRVTDPDEIAAIHRNALTDPIGFAYGNAIWAYAESLTAWRTWRAGGARPARYINPT